MKASQTTASALRRLSFGFVVVAFACLFFADLEINTINPWGEVGRIADGFFHPQVPRWQILFDAVLNTLAFAIQGVCAGAVLGFGLALLYQWRAVRLLCAFLRSIHELFWALIFMQVFGLSALTGLLALTLPYAGTLGKIYGEQFEEVDSRVQQAISLAPRWTLNEFFYTVLPQAWPAMVAYTRYRFECAVRSSLVLGFIGLPTLGFYLDTALKQGQYGEAAALIYAAIAVIYTLRWWLRGLLVPFYLALACWWLPPVAEWQWSLLVRFFTEDIVPQPLRTEGGLSLLEWLYRLASTQILPGVFNTIVVSQLALVLTGFLALVWFPLNSSHFFAYWPRRLGDGFLVIVRTLPEYLLNFLGLIVLGPSMLPALLALSVHNGAIIAHLVGEVGEPLVLREDAPSGILRYAFEVLPRLYRQFLAFLFYRWEIIMRETALLGILGIPTLGFYIDSAFEALFFDRAMLLILMAALLNMAADQLAHTLRQRLHVRATPESL